MDAERIFAVLNGGEVVTYADQLARSRQVAAGLAARGGRPGDRVHVQLANCREFFDVWFAAALSGMVLVPTNPQLPADELGYVLDDAEPVLSLREPADVDALRERSASGTHQVDVDPGPISAILYTSGTTSHPKGVMVTDANYVAVGEAVATHLQITAADRWLVALPLFHANAQYYCTMSALVHGASIALAPRFSASRWGRQARELGATLGSLFAAPIRMILAHPPDPQDTQNSLRAVLFAQNVTSENARDFEERFATPLLQLYGMTETVLPPTINPNGPTRRWHSIGRTLPDVRVDLVDANGDPTGSHTGEMRVAGRKGETLAAGYWHNPEATASAFTAAGLRTGDLARRDADGFIYFVDRSKDMIKRAGENVSAGEIERVASDHPAVAECAVVGIPDPVRDEAILLVATLRRDSQLDEAELIGWCRHRLSDYKVPNAVAFVDSLPRTTVGKIRKGELRSLSPTFDTRNTQHAR